MGFAFQKMLPARLVITGKQGRRQREESRAWDKAGIRIYRCV
jgi:hypothetical protein